MFRAKAESVAKRLKENLKDPEFVEQIVEDIIKYLCKYRSVGTLRLTLDILSNYVIIDSKEILDLYYQIVKPILKALEKRGIIEVIDDQVVNLRVIANE